MYHLIFSLFFPKVPKKICCDIWMETKEVRLLEESVQYVVVWGWH